MRRSFVYLAGPMCGMTGKEARAWRSDAADHLSRFSDGLIGCLSPMRRKSFIRADDVIESQHYYPLRDEPLAQPQGLTARDRNDVMRSDAVLMNFTGARQISAGTFVELGWADLLRKPVVAVCPKDNPNYHPMLLAISAAVVDTLAEGCETIFNILGGQL